MPNGFLDVTVKTFPNFSAFKIGVQSGMRPLVVGCAPSLFRCVRLSIAFPAPGFHRWERPSMCPQPDLNRHTKALAIELQGHVRLAVCTTIVIICEVYRARPHSKALPCIWFRMVALHPPPRRCFGTQRPYMAIRYISPAKCLTALQV